MAVLRRVNIILRKSYLSLAEITLGSMEIRNIIVARQSIFGLLFHLKVMSLLAEGLGGFVLFYFAGGPPNHWDFLFVFLFLGHGFYGSNAKKIGCVAC